MQEERPDWCDMEGRKAWVDLRASLKIVPVLCVILHKIQNRAKSEFPRALEEAYLLSNYQMPDSILGA